MFFFYDLFTHFHDFLSQIGVVILVTPKQEEEKKSKWFCGVKLFSSNFNVESQTGFRTKIRFLAGGFFFVHMRHFDMDFGFFFTFSDLFFKKWFLRLTHSPF